MKKQIYSRKVFTLFIYSIFTLLSVNILINRTNPKEYGIGLFNWLIG